MGERGDYTNNKIGDSVESTKGTLDASTLNESDWKMENQSDSEGTPHVVLGQFDDAVVEVGDDNQDLPPIPEVPSSHEAGSETKYDQARLSDDKVVNGQYPMPRGHNRNWSNIDDMNVCAESNPDWDGFTITAQTVGDISTVTSPPDYYFAAGYAEESTAAPGSLVGFPYNQAHPVSVVTPSTQTMTTNPKWDEYGGTDSDRNHWRNPEKQQHDVPNKEKEPPSFSQRIQQRKVLLGIIAVLLLIIVIIVAVAVPMALKSESNRNDSSGLEDVPSDSGGVTNAPTSSPESTPEVTSSPSITPPNTPGSDPPVSPTKEPSIGSTRQPTDGSTEQPTTQSPTLPPASSKPTDAPTKAPTESPADHPTTSPTTKPTTSPSKNPTNSPTPNPTTASPTPNPTTKSPTPKPTPAPTSKPSFSFPSGVSCSTFVFELETGGNGEDISWEFAIYDEDRDVKGEVIESVGQNTYGNYEDDTMSYCLPDGMYQLSIWDASYEGMCNGSYGGDYWVSYRGNDLLECADYPLFGYAIIYWFTFRGGKWSYENKYQYSL